MLVGTFDTRYPIYKSNGGQNSNTFGVRPVIYLKSFVEIDKANGQRDGSTAELAYEIK